MAVDLSWLPFNIQGHSLRYRELNRRTEALSLVALAFLWGARVKSATGGSGEKDVLDVIGALDVRRRRGGNQKAQI